MASPSWPWSNLEGKDLGALLQERGRLPPGEAVGYLLEACEAIAEAHASGVVHRDIKPSNLFLVRKRDGSSVVKVLDFGISKFTQAGAPSDGAVTRTAALMGSPLYMSPEQMASSKDVDQRSDIWALGVVLYEALTGTVPFIAETLPQICVAVMNHAPAPPARVVPTLPPGLSAVVERCLAKTPAGRYQTIAELAQALAPFSAGAAAAAERITSTLSHRATELAPAVAVTAGTGTQGAWSETRAPRGRRPMLVVAAVAVAGVAGIALLWKTLGRTAAEANEEHPAVVAPPSNAATPLSAAPTSATASSDSRLSEAAEPSVAPAPSAAPSAVVPAKTIDSVKTGAPKPITRRPPPSTASSATSAPRVETAKPAPAATAPASGLGKPGARSRL